MAVNKIIYNKQILIDLTNDTVTADKLFKGVLAHDKSGNQIVGTFEQSLPTGTKIITANGTYDVTDYATAKVNVPVPSGYVKPSGTKYITTTSSVDVTSYAKAQISSSTLTAENIKKDISILGVTGTYEGESSEDVTAEVTEYTNKIASLESVVASLETELANKASGGSGDIETCNLMIDFSAKINSAAIGCDIIDENGDAIGATMYMNSTINLVTIENVVCASSLFILYNGYVLPGFSCENCYKLPLTPLSGSALGTPAMQLHTFKITAPRGETAKITVYNKD